jgi:hypothetical protein
MTQNFPTTNPIAARVDDDVDDDHTIVIPPKAPGDLAIVLPDGCRLWISLPPLAPLLSPVPALLDSAAYDEATIQNILRDALNVTKQQHPALPSPPPVPTPAEDARKPRRPTLTSVAKQAQKAAITVARYEVKPDGTVVVIAGTPEPAEPGNPWFADLPKETKQ